MRSRLTLGPWGRNDSAVTARKALFAVAVLFAIGEALDAIDVGFFAILFAVLFAIGAWLLRRGGWAGVVLVGVLIVWEVVVWPSFDRTTTSDWLIQTPFLVLGIVGLLVLVLVAFRELQARRAPRRR